MANAKLAAYVVAMALMTAVGAVAEAARGSDVAVFVEGDFEIPPLAYFDGRGFKPVHVAYVGEWDKAYWAEARAVVDIPTWSFKRAVIRVPREALGARAPPDARGGVLRIHLNGTVVELVEAPPEVVATYSYLKPDDKITAPRVRSEWVKPPARRGPLDREKQEGQRQEADRQLSQISAYQVSTSTVSPDGAFIYQQFRGQLYANGEVCLNVLRPDSSPSVNPTVASVGYNATYVWRTAWHVYTGSYGVGAAVGRGFVKVWAVDPVNLDKRSLLGQWSVELRNGYVTFSTSIPLSWPNQFVGLELCFVPYYSAVYVIGANATLGFKKNAIPVAGGVYFLGIGPVDRSLHVGGAVAHHVLNPPIRNLLFGPFSLADGYYGVRLNLDMVVTVPWSTPPCPMLTVTTYVGDYAHIRLDSASFAASSYNNGLCRYEVRRSTTLSPTTIGLWYDEARARDKAVVIKVSLSHPASEVVIYRVDISGHRFAENYIDKNVDRWTFLILRGFFSQTLRACSTAKLPQVNRTAVLTNIETYSVTAGIVADFLSVVRGAPSDYVIRGVVFRVRPAEAAVPVIVYVKGDKYEEPWWVTWAFRIGQAVKTALDFFGLLPGPLSWFIDRVFDLRALLNPGLMIWMTADYAEVSWRSGVYDKFYQVLFETGGALRDRTIEVVDVRVSSDAAVLCMFSPLTSPMPRLDTTAPPDLQDLRHWVFGMRVTDNARFIESDAPFIAIVSGVRFIVIE